MYGHARTAPSSRVLKVAPWRRVMVTVPVTPLGSQVTSRVDPAGTS